MFGSKKNSATFCDEHAAKPLKKRRKKWPILVFVPIGTIWGCLILAAAFSFFADAIVKIREMPEITADFEPWTRNGFAAFYDDECEDLRLPGGIDVDLDLAPSFRIVAVSRTEILFLDERKGSDGNVVTQLVSTNWSLGDKRVLLSIDGSWDNSKIDGGSFVLESTSGEKRRYEITVATGEARACSAAESLRWFNVGTFDRANGGYVAEMDDGQPLFVPESALDNDISVLLKKWDFYPSRCLRLSDGSFCCSFLRRTNFFLGGQKAVLLAEVDVQSTIRSYQFYLCNSSYQKSNWAYEIFTSFPEEIVLPME